MKVKNDPEMFYRSCCTAYTAKREEWKKKIYLIGTVRLIWIVTALLTLWLLREKEWTFLIGIAIAYALPFIGLLIYHNKLFAHKAYAEAMIKLCEDEQKGLSYDYEAFDGASDQVNGQHSFSLDLDLFGEKSLFQSINRTTTSMGRERLVQYFLSPLDRKELILERQEAILELAGKPDFCQAFRVTGQLGAGGEKRPEELASFLRQPNRFVGHRRWIVMIWLIPSLWILLVVAYAFGWVGNSWIGLFFAVSFLITNIPATKINRLYQQVDKMEKLLSSYAKLLSFCETEDFQSESLSTTKAKLTKGDHSAARAIRKISSGLGALDQRFSLAGLLMNIFYMRDTRQAIGLEKWKVTYAKDIPCWFDALADFDGQISLGTFAFNHPGYIYPEIAESYFKMEGTGLGHPLIPPVRCVRNKVHIPESPSFLIITGANMAGKSTYLRTIGVNFLLGCMGVPVCADSLTLYPAHLVTSLRTADSLASNESYFFAELKRLKMIIDRLKEGEELFIILDEILKGTNSVDKQKGSLALMKQLVERKACGIIATHDLLLGSLEKEYPEQIKNYRFDADIVDDELSFSYQLREGIAQNMNASFLMKKMGITV